MFAELRWGLRRVYALFVRSESCIGCLGWQLLSRHFHAASRVFCALMQAALGLCS